MPYVSSSWRKYSTSYATCQVAERRKAHSPPGLSRESPAPFSMDAVIGQIEKMAKKRRRNEQEGEVCRGESQKKK